MSHPAVIPLPQGPVFADEDFAQLARLTPDLQVWVHRKYGTECAQRLDLGCNPTETPSSDSLATVQDSHAPIERRLRALVQAVRQKNSKLPKVLVEELRRPALAPEWRDHLLVATERTELQDPGVRSALKELLLRHCLDARDEPCARTEAAVWAGMRRLATLLAVEDVGQLVEFLRPADSARTQQSALQGICNIFEAAGPPADELGRSALCRRVHELAEKCLDPDVVASPQTAVKGALAIAAAVALGDPDLEQLAIRLSRCGRRALERSVARLLTQVYEGWQRRLASGDPFPPAFGRLRVVLAQLLPLPKEKTGTET